MSYRVGFDGVSTVTLTQLLNSVEGSLNTWAFRAHVSADTGSGSLESAPGAYTALIVPCPNGVIPREPNCVRTLDVVHDPNTYVGAAVGIGIALPAGIIVGMVIGFGIAKMLNKSTGGPSRSA